MALTCRYYGITRQAYYNWYGRCQAEGPAGLRDRSRRPQTCLVETPSEVVGKFIYLRRRTRGSLQPRPARHELATSTHMCVAGLPYPSGTSSCVDASILPGRSAGRSAHHARRTMRDRLCPPAVDWVHPAV